MERDEQKIERIIKGAETLFFEYGPSKISMDDIAKRLGMSKKTLYKYFSSKEELIFKVIYSMANSVSASVEKVIKNDELDFLSKMRNMLEAVGYTLSNKITPRFIQDMKKAHPRIWEKIEEYRTRNIITYFNQIFEEGVQAGMLRRDLDRNILLMILLTSVRELINPYVLSEIQVSPQEMFRQIMEVIFEGALTDKAKLLYSVKNAPMAVVEEKNKFFGKKQENELTLKIINDILHKGN